MQTFEKLQELGVLFIDADDFGAIVGVQIGENNSALFAKLRETAAQRHSVGTGFFVGETLEEESFDFRRNGMLKSLCFIVGLGPG